MTYRITRSSPIAYRRSAQALANGEVIHWLQPIVCDCVKRKYLSGESSAQRQEFNRGKSR